MTLYRRKGSCKQCMKIYSQWTNCIETRTEAFKSMADQLPVAPTPQLEIYQSPYMVEKYV